jgi:hypothetical protein
MPYYLKVDIEGMDAIVLAALSSFTDRPRYISVETGPTPKWIDMLHDLSYTGFKLIDQESVVNLRCPHPPLEREWVEHSFKRGSSGPFGEETPGRWLTWQEARHQWLSLLEQREAGKDLWYDVHARLD